MKEAREGTRRVPRDSGDPAATREWRRAESATWLVAVAIYGGWLALTWFTHALPWWLVLPLGGYLVAWQGSLQHEAVHGHPTRVRWINEALAFPNLWLWLPFGVYRRSHLAHHDCARLTCPAGDPESYYVAPQAWQGLGPIRRGLRKATSTLLGRLALGPAVAVCELLAAEVLRPLRGDFTHLGHWLRHAASVAAVLAWTTMVCGIPLWEYVLLFAYPGLSLTLLRSYTEHRPAATQAGRSVIVESGPVFSLLFLNNNLHAVHHQWPELPWILVGRTYRAHRDQVQAGGPACRYAGYRDIVRSFLFRTKDSPVHPGFD